VSVTSPANGALILQLLSIEAELSRFVSYCGTVVVYPTLNTCIRFRNVLTDSDTLLEAPRYSETGFANPSP
jgi:hypothetical protein